MSRFIPAPNLHEILEDLSLPGRVDAANEVVKGARRNAPYRTGQYVDSLQAVRDGDQVRAETDDFAGHIIEWGSVNNPPYAPLRTAAAEVGRFEPS